MLNLLNNTIVFKWIDKLINFINSIFFVFLLAALSFALIFSPPDYLQSETVRIMYVHVPSAWIGLAAFSVIALLSMLNFNVVVYLLPTTSPGAAAIPLSLKV